MRRRHESVAHDASSATAARDDDPVQVRLAPRLPGAATAPHPRPLGAHRVIHDDSHGSSAYDGDSDGSSHNSGYMSDNDRPIIDALLDTAAAAGVTMSALRFSPPLLRPGDPHISNPKVLHALLAGAKDLLHADPRSMEVRAVHGGRLIMVCLRRQR